MKDIYTSYKKAYKVITSCNNAKQLTAARNYTNLFLERYSQVSFTSSLVQGPDGHKYPTKWVKNPSNSLVWVMYEELQVVIEDQEKKIRKKTKKLVKKLSALV